MKKYFFLISAVFYSILINAQWQQTTGGFGIPIRSFAMKDSTIFAGGVCSAGSDMFVSSDNGNTWAIKHNGLPSGFTNVSSMIVNDTTVFASLDMNGVYRTIDKGNNWSIVNIGLVGPYECITSLGIKDSILFVGTCYGEIYRSIDNGNSWSNTGFSQSGNVNCIRTVGSKIFASVFGDGIFVSNDNGNNWSPINSGLLTLNISTLGANGSTIFSGGPYSNYGVYSSNNNGVSWNSASSGLSSNVGVSSFISNGSTIFVAVQTSVYMSLNNGSSWINISNGLNSNYIYSLAIHGNYLYAGTNSGGPGTIWRRSLNEVVTAINESDKAGGKITVFPNPSDAQATLYSDQALEDATIQIYNSLGEQVKKIEKVNGKVITIKNDELSGGIYFLNIIQDNKIVSTEKMIIKQ